MAIRTSASVRRLLLCIGVSSAAMLNGSALFAQETAPPATITPVDPGTGDEIMSAEPEAGIGETVAPSTPATRGTDSQSTLGEGPIGTDADRDVAGPEDAAAEGSPAVEGDEATPGEETAEGQAEATPGEAGAVQQVGAPVASASYDLYQNQLGISGIGVTPSRAARQTDSALVLSDTLDRYRSLAAPAQSYRGATVLNRRRPEYDATGLQVGSFTVFPVAGVKAAYSSNVLRQDNSVEDVYGLLSGEVLARSDWGRHQLLLNAAVNNRSYATYTSEDRTTYAVNGGARIDISDAMKVFASASNSYDTAPRRSVVELIQTRSPVKFHENEAELRLAVQGNRLRGSIGVAYQQRDYRDARSPDGAFLNQQFRDFHSWEITGELGYEFSPGRSMFVRVSNDRRRFRLDTGRDVDVIHVLSGLSSEITPLITGRIAVGYLWADFTDRGTKTRGGATFLANLSYLATELTTVTLEGRRELTNVATPGIANAFRTSVDLTVDHELYRNVIISGSAGYRRSDYTSSPLVGQQWLVEAGPKWLINRKTQLGGKIGYSWSRNNSSVVRRRADTLEILVGLTFQL